MDVIMATSLLRKKATRKQGLKILTYGTDGTGKSVYGLRKRRNLKQFQLSS